MNGHFHLFAVTFSVNFTYETHCLLFLAYTFLCLWPYCFSYLNFFPPPQLPKYFLPGNMKCYLPNSSSASKNIFCSLQLLWLIFTTQYITIITCTCAHTMPTGSHAWSHTLKCPQTHVNGRIHFHEFTVLPMAIHGSMYIFHSLEFIVLCYFVWGFPHGSAVKNLPAM